MWAVSVAGWAASPTAAAVCRLARQARSSHVGAPFDVAPDLPRGPQSGVTVDKIDAGSAGQVGQRAGPRVRVG